MGARIGSITFNGLASGFPTEDIINQVLELEGRPIELLEGQRDSFNEKLAIFQDLGTKTRALRDILRDIDNMNSVGSGQSAFEEFLRFSASSSDETIATATSQPGGVSSLLTVRVDALAAQDRHISDAFSADDASVDVASIDIQFGTDPSQNVVIDTATPEGIIAAINGADIGVRAYLIDNGNAVNPSQIFFESDTTGADQDFTITVNAAGAGETLAFNQTQNASDAALTLDPDGGNPVSISSGSNTFSNVAPGLSVTVHKIDAASITIGRDENADAIAERMSELATAFGEIVDVINAQFEVDPTTNRGGLLIGDSTLISLKQQLTGAVSQLFGDTSSTVRASAQIGLEIDRSGKLVFDEAVFRAKFASDPSGVAEFFAGPDAFADKIRGVTDFFGDIVDGALIRRVNSINESVTDLEDNIRAAEARLDTIEANLVAQFTALERTIASLRQQGDFLNQFLLASNR